jgi:uncharacterized metal-binding protein
MMADQKTFIYSCSGASDVGCLTDAVARRLTKEGRAQMQCLVGIGGRIEFLMERAAANPNRLVIDGCDMNCAKQCMHQAGFDSFEYVNLAENGFVKGASPADEANIAKAQKIIESKI